MWLFVSILANSSSYTHFYNFIFFFNKLQTDGNGDPDEVKLDAEMEKVFAGSNRDKEKFDIKQFSDSNDGKSDSSASKLKTKYNQDDYDCKYIIMILIA